MNKTLLKAFGFERVTKINPPLHGSTIGWRGNGTMLSEHENYLLFHYHGGNITINSNLKLARLVTFLRDSK